MLVIAALTAALRGWSAEAVRERRNFDDGWMFHLGDVPGGEQPGRDESGWRKLNLPHDWTIEGPYSARMPAGPGFCRAALGGTGRAFGWRKGLAGGRSS